MEAIRNSGNIDEGIIMSKGFGIHINIELLKNLMQDNNKKK